MPDCLSHYIHCCRLWTEVDEATGVDVDVAPDTMMQRLLLDFSNAVRVRRLTVAFSVCHAIKLGHLEAIRNSIASDSFTRFLDLAKGAAAAFATKCPGKRKAAPTQKCLRVVQHDVLPMTFR